MKAHAFVVGSMLSASAALPLAAQVPQLGSVEAPYPAIQSTVHVAGGAYGPGAVAYGQIGAPLVLTGSNLGTSGTVQFLGYMNGVADGKNAAATVTLWTPTLLILSVPPTAFTGLIKVTTSGGTSNGLPFIVMPGPYAPSCPVAADDSDFQIVTSSLQDGTLNQSYSVTLSATGGLPPYTWSNIGNALPSGMSLSSTGLITGTPTGTPGTVSLTIQAQDNNHLITQALLNLKVDSTLLTTGPVYSYSASYDGVGNVSGYTDSVMGAWSFQYDTLNRLATGNATTGDYDGQYACWNYDSFGNRQQQVLSSAAFPSGSGGANACQPPSTANIATDLATYTSSNQITETNAPGVTAAPGYDAAGNITSDGVHNYLYDAEGRICAVAYTPVGGSTTYYGYEYDAEGNRVAKGTITTTISNWSCDPSVNGLSYTESYVLGTGGEQLTMLDGSGHWQRTNVYAGGLLATYDTTNLHFHLTDPLGTRRLQTNAMGQAESDCESLPYGDELTCFPVPNAPNTADDSTPLHFTGQERDSESGNDYFGARYYSSAMGRFMSPDPSGLVYADPTNPQSLNLYSYVLNNPLSFTDPTGEYCFYGGVGDTPENDSDPTDFVWDDEPGDCHGQWIDNPSTTMTVYADSGEVDTTSMFPDSTGSNPPQISQQNCQQALFTYHRQKAGVTRSAAQFDVLLKAADAHNIPVQVLEGIAVTETNAQNITGDHGHGRGEFQFDDRAHPELIPFAYDIPRAANIAAGLLEKTVNKYQSSAPRDLAIMAAIRNYNGGGDTSAIVASRDGSLLDANTTGNDYVSTVMAIAANCY